MTPAAGRAVVEHLQSAHAPSACRACRIEGLSRSVLHKPTKDWAQADAPVIDEGNREALRIECGRSIPATRLVRVMKELIEAYGKPRAIRLDNGPEMTAEAFVQWARDEGIALW